MKVSLLTFSALVASVVGNDCASRLALPATFNNSGGGEAYCVGSGNSTVWLEYTGTCIGQAQICLQSNNGQCATGTPFNLFTNSFRGSCSNLSPRAVGCDDNNAASTTCADFGCGVGFSEFVSFPTSVNHSTILLVASQNDTAVGTIRATVVCDARNAVINSAPLVLAQGEVATLNITTDHANPTIVLYSSVNCGGVSLSSPNYFECTASPVVSAQVNCSGNCLVNFTQTTSLGAGQYFWFIAPTRPNFAEFRYSTSPLVILPDCGATPSAPCCKFCLSNIANCTTYPDLRTCQTTCSGWLSVPGNAQTGNTPECRTNFSTSGNSSECAFTDATGGGKCVPSCDAFCSAQASLCGVLQFANASACMQQCGNWTAGSLNAISGNNLACRWNRLAQVQHGGALAQCEDTGSASTICFDTLQPTTSAPTNAPSTITPTTAVPTSAPSNAPTATPTTPAPTLAPTSAAPTRAPTTVTPTTGAPTRAPTSIDCPETAVSNLYKYCKSEDFVGTGNCKIAGKLSPCSLVCRLYSETFEKQLVCPNGTTRVNCAAFCFGNIVNQSMQFNSSALNCMANALGAGLPMCGYGAVGSASFASLSIVPFVFILSLLF